MEETNEEEIIDPEVIKEIFEDAKKDTPDEEIKPWQQIRPKRVNTSHCAECGEFIIKGGRRDLMIFCSPCGRKKCKRCFIVLSTKYECFLCGTKHGKPSVEKPDDYCYKCIYFFI